MTQEITTQIIDVNQKPFEIYMCGDQTSRKLALFLHGFPQCGYMWRHQMQQLADMGYKCWAPNLRGYGQSYSPTEISEYQADILSNDVAEIMDASNCKSVTLIGHDWGGFLTWIVALQNIRPLDKVIVMNMPHPSIFSKEVRKWKQLKRIWYMLFFQIPKLPEYLLKKNNGEIFKKTLRGSFCDKSKLTPDALEIYYKNIILRPDSLTTMLNWYRATFRKKKQLEITLHNLTKEKQPIPILLIWGEKDLALGIRMTLGMEKYLNNFTIRYISYAGHFVAEDAPTEVNTILKACLEGKPVPGSSQPSQLK